MVGPLRECEKIGSVHPRPDALIPFFMPKRGKIDSELPDLYAIEII